MKSGWNSRIEGRAEREQIMPRVGVLLSGCGVQDGSEIYEAVLTLLALEREGATVRAIAPDVDQAMVVNHYTGAEDRREGFGAARHVLTEAARIVRGKIMSTNEISAHDLDALIIPGGYGVVRNLCTYGTDSVDATVNDSVARLIRELNALGKPIGAICVAPILVALALKGKSLSLTVGNDAALAADLGRLGATHVVTGLDEIHIDEANHVVSTSAFLLAQTPLEAQPGIDKLVGTVVRMARHLVA